MKLFYKTDRYRNYSIIVNAFESWNKIQKQLKSIRLSTLTANYEYSRSNRENLPLPIQIKLSKKPSIFCCIFFFAFLEFKLNFQCSEKKNEPHRSSISAVIDSGTCAYLNA